MVCAARRRLGQIFQAQHDLVVLEQRNRLGQGASGARTQWLALRGNGDLGQGHRPCRRQCELAHDPGPARRYGDRRALHPQGDLADAGRRLRLATGLAARRMAPLRPAAVAKQHGLRRRQRRDAQISHRLPAVVLPAGRGRGRDGAVVLPRRVEVRAALFLDRRRQSAQRRAVGRPAREMDSRPRPDQCLARAARAGRRADSRRACAPARCTPIKSRSR